MAKFVAKIRFGSRGVRDEIYSKENPYHEFTFETEGEVAAFFKGVDEMDGWADYEVVEDD